MKAERQQASSDDGAGESFFISKHTYSSSIRSRAKASSQDEFSYLEGSDLYACFSSTAQFFSLEALKNPLSIQSVPHIKNGYCNCFHGLYPPWMVEEDQKLWNIKIAESLRKVIRHRAHRLQYTMYYFYSPVSNATYLH